jgi:hypothetical protein
MSVNKANLACQIMALVIFLFRNCVFSQEVDVTQKSTYVKFNNATANRKLIVHTPPNCNPHFHDHDSVAITVSKAQESLKKFNEVVPMADRLPVMILFSQGASWKAAMPYYYMSLILPMYRKVFVPIRICIKD